MANGINSNGPFDVREAWEKVKAWLDKATPEEKRQTLVNAGILEPSGAVAKPYRGVIR